MAAAVLHCKSDSEVFRVICSYRSPLS